MVFENQVARYRDYLERRDAEDAEPQSNPIDKSNAARLTTLLREPQEPGRVCGQVES